MAPITPLHSQDFTSVELEHPLESYHPSTPVAELEAPALVPRVDLEAPASALETWAHSVVLACHMDHQAVFSGQTLALEAQALAWEAPPELQAQGLQA